MRTNDVVSSGHENTTLLRYEEIDKNYPNTYSYDDIMNHEIKGVLLVDRYIDGKLYQTYSSDEAHVLTIAATRLGKTTQCVIPLVASFANQKVKKSFIVSDPKCELYRLLSNDLKDKGYDVLLLNFRDYKHSELWNPLTSIYKKYHEIMSMDKKIEGITIDGEYKFKFDDHIYDNYNDVNSAIKNLVDIELNELDKEINRIAMAVIPPDESSSSDEYWTIAPRKFLKALLYSMLEDSMENRGCKINENTFSFNTLFKIFCTLTENERYDDDGYFTSREEGSKAMEEARAIIENAPNTRLCVISSFIGKMEAYSSSNMRLITSRNSFDMSKLISDKPVAIFICYPDQTKLFYEVISSFVKEAFNYLIDYCDNVLEGKLKKPFYFILDEFGNFPAIPDFDNVISACGGRNIWFYLVLQSYAQLDNVYGRGNAQVIKDNLNIHIFLGSNNPDTLSEFSRACGEKTRLSALSALKGDKEEIEYYDIETVPLVPKSILSSLGNGECIITQANCGYVLYSKLERYYKCKKFD